MSKIPLDHLADAAEPISTIDLEQLRTSIDQMFTRLGAPKNFVDEELNRKGFSSVNLTHLPRIKGYLRWEAYRQNHNKLPEGISEGEFTVMLSEIEDLYLGQVIRDISAMHLARWGTPFQGRHQLVWIAPGRCYPLHKDDHTAHRYHIPVRSDAYCWFLFETDEGDLHRVWMPADGRVWYLNPHRYPHTVVHLGYLPRLHLLMTSEH